jgi:hypothetical protein
MNNLQLTLFNKYAELLRRRFSDDFQEVGCRLLIVDIFGILTLQDCLHG